MFAIIFRITLLRTGHLINQLFSCTGSLVTISDSNYARAQFQVNGTKGKGYKNDLQISQQTYSHISRMKVFLKTTVTLILLSAFKDPQVRLVNNSLIDKWLGCAKKTNFWEKM